MYEITELEGVWVADFVGVKKEIGVAAREFSIEFDVYNGVIAER